MTAKKKAGELYNKYLLIVRQSDIYDTQHNRAKEAATICVDEILALGTTPKEPSSIRVYGYYSAVKIEISKL